MATNQDKTMYESGLCTGKLKAKYTTQQKKLKFTPKLICVRSNSIQKIFKVLTSNIDVWAFPFDSEPANEKVENFMPQKQGSPCMDAQ